MYCTIHSKSYQGDILYIPPLIPKYIDIDEDVKSGESLSRPYVPFMWQVDYFMSRLKSRPQPSSRVRNGQMKFWVQDGN